MKSQIALVVSLFAFAFSNAQNINQQDEKWALAEKAMNISGMDISADGSLLAVACATNEPLKIYDWRAQEVLKEIDVKTDNLGYNVHYSPSGKYLVLQEKTYTNNIKKAKKSNFIIVDLASSKQIHFHRKISDLKIHPDENSFLTLEDGVIHFRDMGSGKIQRNFEIKEARNAFAISPDGKDLAIVVEPTKDRVKEVPSVRNDKKAMKAALKYRHMISVYDLESLKLKKEVAEVYDNINLLSYSHDGSKLLNFNAGQNSYVNVIDAQSYEPSREAYLSRTSVQPDYAFSPDKTLFAIASVEKFPSVNVYDSASGSIVDTYDTKNKIWKSMKKKMYPGSYSSFVFLPDGKHLLIAYGNALIKWKIEK